MAHLRKGIAEALPCPADVTRAGSLSELARSTGLYVVDRGARLATWGVSKLKLSRRHLKPKECASVLPPEVAKYLIDPDKWIVKSDQELCEGSDAGVPRRPY